MWKSFVPRGTVGAIGPGLAILQLLALISRRGHGRSRANPRRSTWNTLVAAAQNHVRSLDCDVRVLAVKAKKDDDSEEGRSEQYLYDTVIQNLLVGV